MDSPTLSTSQLLRKSTRFSDVVTAIIPYNRQKGFETIIFNTLAILLSVTILFLLTQVYLIFLPCIKALLWALLCGSALFPFKVRLTLTMQNWLDNLNKSNRSFTSGLIVLPFQLVYQVYFLLIGFISQNKVLFLLFHFRFQIVHALSIVVAILVAILNYNKGIITAFVILFTTVQIFLLIYRRSLNLFDVLSSFNVIPSILLLLVFYLLHSSGVIGYVAFILFSAISSLGFIISFYSFTHDKDFQTQIVAEFNALVDKVNAKTKPIVEKCLETLRQKFQLSEDSVDGDGSNVGKLYMSILFIVFVFVLVEKMQLSNIILSIFLIHLATIRVVNKIYHHSVDIIELVKIHLIVSKDFVADKLHKDIVFQCFIYFFLKGDLLIKKCLQNSLDLISSIGIMLSVTVMVILFSIFLSVKIYGECYFSINLLRNELSKVEYIKEGINLTLNNADYLNNFVRHNLFYTDKLNLKEEEKDLINKMLLDFSENIIVFFNSSSGTANLDNATLSLDDSLLLSANDKGFKSLLTLWPELHLDKFQFDIILKFINSRANSYLPLFKSTLSIVYAFIFIILDGSSVLFNFILNFFIFALALFYLLSTSRDKYKPIELLDNIVSSLITNSEQNRFSRYVEELINSIFAATIKISAFYGIYTWLLHSLFGIQISCIPSVIAAILAAVPLLNAYWASLPSCIYLYYFDLNLPFLKSLAMFVTAIIPSLIVDSSIYSDIKRAGHPYLTGLAITCGVVYYGFEGALFGPLWLCFLFIILNMCTTLTENNLNNSFIFSPTR